MKWFKHFSDSLDDPFIVELMDEYSHQGYVAFFGLIEVIAKENGSKLTGKLEISPRYLKRKLRISSTKLQQIFNFCSTKGKLSCDFSQEKWKFELIKILELKDNYTKDLQAPRKKPSNHKEVEEEVEVEKEKPKPSSSELKKPVSSKANGKWPEDDIWLKDLVMAQSFFTDDQKIYLTDHEWWEDIDGILSGIDHKFLEKQFLKIKVWKKDNDRRWPTAKGIRRFTKSWLEKAKEEERKRY